MRVVLEEDTEMLDEVVVVGYGVQRKSALTGSVARALGGRVAGVQVRGNSSPRIRIRGVSSVAVPEDAYVEDMPEISDDDFREVFSEALAFEPFLYPDSEGKVDIVFNTSDKLSTYHVNVFAHDPSMRNAVLRKDLIVTIPVQISVTPPRYLYEEDKYILSASVSNISNNTLSGCLYLRVEMDDAVEERQPTYAQATELTVPAGGTAAALFTITAPPSFQPSFVGWWDDPKLDLRLVFEGDGFTDAVRIPVPVNRAEQSLTESHSALAGPEAIDSLRRMFVNLPGDQAEVAYRMLREMAETGLEQWTAPEDPDALSRSADFYARALLGRDTTGTLAPLLALRQDDGGFAWTEGMDSSPIVTATLLERFAVLRDRGIAIPDMTETVRYLDNSQFGNWWPMWCGGLSDEQYMDIRAMWSEVPFDLTYLVMDPGYTPENRKKLEDNAALLQVPVTVFETDVFRVANKTEKSPCYLCARMRRGHLYAKAKALGCNKIALGHHFSDVIETTVMAMFFGSQLQGMMPKVKSLNFEGMELIRPLYCVNEKDIIAWARYNGLSFLQCACRFTEQLGDAAHQGASKRQEVKELIRTLKNENPDVEKSIFSAIHNVCLDTFPAYKTNGELHSFLERYDSETRSEPEE